MFYDAAKRDHGLPQDPLKSLIVPRPIGWISTVDRQGRVNLAPYSFYNAMSEFPPIVCFGITGTYGSTPTKHSRMNAESTGEFVVNMASESLKEQMNVTTTMVEFGVDELKLAGLTPEPSTLVKPPRVKESPVGSSHVLAHHRAAGREGHGPTRPGGVAGGGVHIDDGITRTAARYAGFAGRAPGLQRIHHDRQRLAHEAAGRSEVSIGRRHGCSTIPHGATTA